MTLSLTAKLHTNPIICSYSLRYVIQACGNKRACLFFAPFPAVHRGKVRGEALKGASDARPVLADAGQLLCLTTTAQIRGPLCA